MFELMLFNSDLVRQRQVDYAETLRQTMRAARGSWRPPQPETIGSEEIPSGGHLSGQRLARSAAADCG